jgi:lauroyl/myristoyl acyltransferase
MLGFCDFISAVMYRFDDKGRRQSLANLRVIYGKIKCDGVLRPVKVYDPTKAEEKIIRRSYRNMARTVGHAFWTCRNAVERVKKAGEMSEAGKRFLAENKPAVTVSGHIGCWEILSQLAFLEGHPMMSVAKDIGTGGMTKLLMKARTSIGQEIVHADGAFRPLMQGIKEGKSLGLLVDQVVDTKDGGVWVKFFGVPITVSAAPAFFSAKGKAPIVVAWSRPLKDGRYRCEVVTSYKPEDARDIRGMTQKCIRDLESIIRRHPSAWVLNYNFFRNIPDEKTKAVLN